MATNTVYIAAIGVKYTKTLWAKDSLKAWEHYCNRHNLNLHVQTEPVLPFREKTERPHFEKFGFIKWNQPGISGSILVTDLDNLPKPQAPNVFELHSDRNITCRVNPYWHLKHSSYHWADAETLNALRWPKFRDVNKGKGQWPDADLWFFVCGSIMLLPPNVQAIFRENHTRIVRETPSWDFSLDEGVWAFWIARFNLEYGMGVDAFDPRKWAATGVSVHSDASWGQSILPACHVAHFYGRRHHALSARYYTQWYILNSQKETLGGTILWVVRVLLALQPAHLRILIRRAFTFFRIVASKLVRHLLPPPPPTHTQIVLTPRKKDAARIRFAGTERFCFNGQDNFFRVLPT